MSRPPMLVLALLALATAGCARHTADPAASSGEAGEEETSVTVVSREMPFGPPAPPPPTGPLRVLVGGDLLPHRPSLVAPAAIREALAPLAPLFATADAVIANYEAATGDVDAKSPRLAYAAPPDWLAELPKAGLRAVTVANNHACDLGEPGLGATLDAASKSGLEVIGGDARDPWTPRIVVESSGKRVCAVAWTTLVNSEGACAKSSRLAVAPLSGVGKTRIDRAIARARSECDATIAILHGGEEYRTQTTQVLDQAAHAAEAGADAVVVHHPHVASPVVVHETKNGRRVPIFASVGNLVTNQGESWKPPMFPVLRENRRLVCVNGWTRLGVVADLAFRFDEAPARLDWGFHLTWVDNEHAENKAAPVPRITARPLDPKSDGDVIARLSEDAAGPVALFSDPCWAERAGGAGDADRDDSRCHATLAPPGLPSRIASPAPVAARAPGRRAPPKAGTGGRRSR